jgi:4-alpha-glucanotransferase
MIESAGSTAPPQAAPRTSGVFAPITSLPTSHGIGDMGPSARRFADVLADGGQSIWQVLPLAEPGNPANSPYDNHSGYALNRWLVSPDDLVDDGLLTRAQVDAARPAGLPGASEAVDYGAAQRWKGPLVEQAADNLLARAERDPALAKRLAAFEQANAHWLGDYVDFMHLKRANAAQDPSAVSRSTWPATDRTATTARVPEVPTHEMRRTVAEQFLADQQWTRLREHAASRGVRMMSDLPFYEGDDGVAAWKRPELFELDDRLQATHVGGAPPEPAFPAGQAWGMPSYRTGDRAALLDHFAQRIEHEARRVGPGGVVRLDHLLGAAEPYSVDLADASRSRFVSLFSGSEWRELLGRFPDVTFVGEDLGELTAGRAAFMDELDPARMRVGLQSLMESPGDLAASAHFADNVGARDVVFTGGTHDYPFLRTYLADNWDDEGVRNLRGVLAERGYVSGTSAGLEDVARGAMQLNADSPARTAITQVFDLLGMGGGESLPAVERALNVPGTSSSTNWATRIPEAVVEPGSQARGALVDTMRGVAQLARRL